MTRVAMAVVFFTALSAIRDRAEAGVVLPWLTISESEVDPWAQRGAPFAGQRSLYVWVDPGSNDRFEFGLTGTFELVSLTGRGACTAQGSMTAWTVSADSCLSARYYLIAELVVSDSTGAGGSVCLSPNSTTGRACEQACGGGSWYFFAYGGYSTAGPPCVGHGSGPDCIIDAIDSPSWGRLKVGYRR